MFMLGKLIRIGSVIACKAPPPSNEAGTRGVGAAAVVVPGKGLNSDVVNPDPNSSPLRLEENKAARLRSGGATLVNEKKDREKLAMVQGPRRYVWAIDYPKTGTKRWINSPALHCLKAAVKKSFGFF